MHSMQQCVSEILLMFILLLGYHKILFQHMVFCCLASAVDWSYLFSLFVPYLCVC